jgi:hypothetical protein
VSGERIEVGPRPGKRSWLVAHQCGEVPERHYLIVGSQPLHQVLKVKPDVPPTILVVEPVVEVETVHVGDDGGHGTPRNIV